MAATPQAPTPTLSFFAGAHPSQSSECFLLDDVTIRSQ
jgi:hypothetical protein